MWAFWWVWVVFGVALGVLEVLVQGSSSWALPSAPW